MNCCKLGHSVETCRSEKKKLAAIQCQDEDNRSLVAVIRNNHDSPSDEESSSRGKGYYGNDVHVILDNNAAASHILAVKRGSD